PRHHGVLHAFPTRRSSDLSDGKIGGINLDTTDRFALDGQRLLLKSGIYGDDGAEYQTEQYSNIRIISKGISPIGTEYTPEYFEVYYPDGSFALDRKSTRLNSSHVKISY